jgi:hypothetical protein
MSWVRHRAVIRKHSTQPQTALSNCGAAIRFLLHFLQQERIEFFKEHEDRDKSGGQKQMQLNLTTAREDRKRYIESLRAADRGDCVFLLDFVRP